MKYATVESVCKTTTEGDQVMAEFIVSSLTKFGEDRSDPYSSCKLAREAFFTKMKAGKLGTPVENPVLFEKTRNGFKRVGYIDMKKEVVVMEK